MHINRHDWYKIHHTMYIMLLRKNHNKTNRLDFGILLLNEEILTINYKLPASELLLTPLTFQQV